MVAVHQLDVDVLVERPRKAFTRGRENPPAGLIISDEPESTVFRRITQPKYRDRLEPPVEKYDARRRSAACDDCHGEKVDPHVSPGNYRGASLRTCPVIARDSSEHRYATVAPTSSRSTNVVFGPIDAVLVAVRIAAGARTLAL